MKYDAILRALLVVIVGQLLQPREQKVESGTSLEEVRLESVGARIDLLVQILIQLFPDPSSPARRIPLPWIAARAAPAETIGDLAKAGTALVRRAENLASPPSHGSAAGPAEGAVEYRVVQKNLTIAPEPPAVVDYKRERAFSTTVFFATDRARTPHRRLGTSFGSGRGKALTYGQCEVSIPKSRVVGEMPTPKWWRLEFTPDPDKHVFVKGLDRFGPTEFFDAVRQRVEQSPDKQAFVFIHGFNVSFEGAVTRTAQLALDLKFDGAPILYSWPSRGQLLDYNVDAAAVSATVGNLRDFLTGIAAATGAEKVHIIAHSMGNRALCDALRLVAAGGLSPSTTRLGHIVLAAPDVDADTFAQVGGEIQKAATSITLYASSRDQAIRVSKRYNGGMRAGEPIVVVPGLDSVDASSVDTDFLSHGYFSDSRAMLNELYELLLDRSAASRFNIEAVTAAAGDHFRFKK